MPSEESFGGREYGAYCVDERGNAGGWVSYRSNAERLRAEHLQVYPDHTIEIRVRDSDDTGGRVLLYNFCLPGTA